MIQQEFMDQDPVQRIKAVSGEVSGQSFLHLYRLHGLVEWGSTNHENPRFRQKTKGASPTVTYA